LGVGRAAWSAREAPRRRLPAIQLPKVGLEPTPSCEHRILSPARLPSAWRWKQVAVVLKVCESKARTSPPWCFRIVAAGADVANTVPNLFPTRARIEAGTGLIMGDGLTRAATDVGSSVQTLSPVIRGRCRDGLPSERDKTAWRSGPRSCQPGVFRWTRFSASVQIQSPRFLSERSPSARTMKGVLIVGTRVAPPSVQFKYTISRIRRFAP
jgi:hypothetical protein